LAASAPPLNSPSQTTEGQPSSATGSVIPVLLAVAAPLGVDSVGRRLPSRRGRAARRLPADGANPVLLAYLNPRRPPMTAEPARKRLHASPTSRGAPSASLEPLGRTSGRAPIATAKYGAVANECGDRSRLAPTMTTMKAKRAICATAERKPTTTEVSRAAASTGQPVYGRWCSGERGQPRAAPLMHSRGRVYPQSGTERS
jgi:hypothetical protein